MIRITLPVHCLTTEIRRDPKGQTMDLTGV
jgi:hypothetical protein